MLTFKALQDPLDTWTLKELAAHGVNYRKQISPNPKALLPESDFRLLAVSMRFPRRLAGQVTLQPRGPGAYDVVWGVETIRILVLREMPEADQNLVWNLFSSDPERIAAAFQRLGPRPESWSSLLNDLLGNYGLEGMAMPYTMEDYKRDSTEEFLSKLTPEQLLAHLSPEQRLRGLSPEQYLEALSTDQLLSLLPLAERYLKKHKAAQEKDTLEQPETPS